jgi:hypothetical protein
MMPGARYPPPHATRYSHHRMAQASASSRERVDEAPAAPPFAPLRAKQEHADPNNASFDEPLADVTPAEAETIPFHHGRRVRSPPAVDTTTPSARSASPPAPAPPLEPSSASAAHAASSAGPVRVPAGTLLFEGNSVALKKRLELIQQRQQHQQQQPATQAPTTAGPSAPQVAPSSQGGAAAGSVTAASAQQPRGLLRGTESLLVHPACIAASDAHPQPHVFSPGMLPTSMTLSDAALFAFVTPTRSSGSGTANLTDTPGSSTRGASTVDSPTALPRDHKGSTAADAVAQLRHRDALLLDLGLLLE